MLQVGLYLVHPEQVVEDLALPTQWQAKQAETQNTPSKLFEKNNEESSDIPDYLITLYKQLDWVGQDIDQLAAILNLDIATLTGYLMELELSGLCMQQSGLYVRCRSNK